MTPQQVSGIDAFRAEAYAVIDSWCENAVAEAGTGCREGCAFCCYNVVTLSLLEAVVILRNETGRAAVAANYRKLVDIANLFIRRDPVTRLGPWRARNERCLFLGDCDRCLIYEDRPFNCRTHIAARPCDPDQDGNYYVDPIEATPMGLRLNEFGAERTGLPFAFHPMPVALLIADAILKAGLERVERTYSGTPFLHPMGSSIFWAYIEMESER